MGLFDFFAQRKKVLAQSIQPKGNDARRGTSKENPIVITRPGESELLRVREAFKEVLMQGAVKDGPGWPFGESQEKALDTIISESMKMELIKAVFGEEKKVWECGTRLYLGAIQSQEIIFKDGRAPITLWFDFSQFGWT